MASTLNPYVNLPGSARDALAFYAGVFGGEPTIMTFGESGFSAEAGGTPEEARPHAFYAFNQGFYNLFLALQALTGVALVALGHVGVGAALILAGTGAMLAAAVVLALASAPHRGAAAKQGILPLLAVSYTIAALLG